MKAERKWKAQIAPKQAYYERLALLKCMGYQEEELAKPLVGVIHGWNEMAAGDYHLRAAVDAVKASIRSAGGTPVEVNVPALCAGMNAGTLEARYSFPYRDFAAGMVEIMLHAYQCDGAIVIPTCDYTVPAYLMGIARVNIPTVVLTGGYMDVGDYKGRPITGIDAAVAYAAYKVGRVSAEEFYGIVNNACPTPGACPLIATANTMCVVTESLGMSLPGNATTPAMGGPLLCMAKSAGSQILKLIEKDLKPSDILTLESFKNMITTVLAIGGSMNAVVHSIAIARQVGIDLNLDIWDKLSRKTPFLCSLMPNHPTNTMREFRKAGGVMALMKELSPLLNLDVMTVTCKKLLENLKDIEVLDRDIIRPMDNPYRPEGGIAILKGSLAPGGAVVKASAVPLQMLRHEGPAVVYNSEEEAIQGLMSKKVKEGDVVVIKYEGPRGGPGAREPSLVMHTVNGLGLINSVAVVSDSRFSGTNKGCAVGHVCPEAADGGPLAAVENGDMIEIDIPRRKLDIKISKQELDRRLKTWTPPQKETKGVLELYARMGLPLNVGGGL